MAATGRRGLLSGEKTNRTSEKESQREEKGGKGGEGKSSGEKLPSQAAENPIRDIKLVTNCGTYSSAATL